MKKVIFLLTILFSQKAIAQNVPSYVPSTGLVGWWPFSGNAVDSSLLSFPGIVNGATLTTDRFGNTNKAYYFNGIDNNIVLGDLNYISTGVVNEYTVSIWVNLYQFNNATTGDQSMIFGDEISQNNGTAFQIHNIYGFGSYTAGSTNWVGYCNCLPNLNTWIHYVVVQKSTGQYLYINGNLWGLLTTVLNSDVTNPIRIGLFTGVGGSALRPLNGKLDDIGIWNRALTQQEITALYNYAPASVNNLSGDKSLFIYPNPAKDKLYIKDMPERMQVKIYNAIGQLMLESTQKEIDIAALSNGQYFIMIFDEQKQLIQNELFIKE